MKNVQSWAELHAGLKEVGLRLEKKGSGAIVRVGQQAVNASSIDRAFSMGKLCKRLGEFELGDYANAAPQPESEPLHPALLPAWRMFRSAATAENETQKGLEEKAKEEVKLLKEAQTRERKEKLVRIATYGMPFLNICRHCLKLEHVQQLRLLRDRLKAKLSPKKKKRFSKWLKAQGVPVRALPAIVPILVKMPQQ